MTTQPAPTHPLTAAPPAAPPPTGEGNQLRQDPFTGRWVVIAAGRAARPDSFRRPAQPLRGPLGCPFCAGNEHLTPPEVWADRDPAGGWTVRVVPNKFAAFTGRPGRGSARSGGNGWAPAAGAHEVVVHGGAHRTTLTELSQATLARVVGAWRNRLARWASEPLGAVILIVNQGAEAGASLEHSHAQVFATALRPELIQAEVERLAGDGCAACAAVAAERGHGDRLVAEADGLLTVCPWASFLPLEMLVLPIGHTARFEHGGEATDRALARTLTDVLGRLGQAAGLEPPVNLVLHSAPPGVDDFHWHLHVLPRLTALGGFELGTGVVINVVDPERAAERLR